MNDKVYPIITTCDPVLLGAPIPHSQSTNPPALFSFPSPSPNTPIPLNPNKVGMLVALTSHKYEISDQNPLLRMTIAYLLPPKDDCLTPGLTSPPLTASFNQCVPIEPSSYLWDINHCRLTKLGGPAETWSGTVAFDPWGGSTPFSEHNLPKIWIGANKTSYDGRWMSKIEFLGIIGELSSGALLPPFGIEFPIEAFQRKSGVVSS